MPLLYQQNINEQINLAIWKMEEEEDFFVLEGYHALFIKHDEKRKQHLAGRFLLRTMMPGLNMENVELDKNGKPFIKGSKADFSISHSGDLVTVLVAMERRVGVDVEEINDRILRVQHKFMSEKDEEAFQSTAFTNTERATICWTVKEAVYKLHGKSGVDFKRDIRLKKISKTQEGWEGEFEFGQEESSILICKGFKKNNAFVSVVEDALR